MEHEADVLTRVTDLRSSWADAKTVDEKAKLDNELSDTFKNNYGCSRKLSRFKSKSKLF